MKRSFIMLSAALLLGAATATIPATVSAAPAGYKAAGPKGGIGWTTHETDNGRYVVTYTGGGKVKKDMVAKYALLRAAEFTQESGFEWFAVITSIVRDVEEGGADDMAGRTGNFMGNTTTGTTGTGGGNNMAGNGGGSFTMGGASTGGFGGGDVPPSVLEHWTPKKIPQAVLIIQMGKGDDAHFEGLTKQPDIFDAKSTVAELSAEPAK